jgi:integrase
MNRPSKPTSRRRSDRRKLSNVRPLDLQTLYANLQEKGLKPQTVRRVHNLLHNAFKQAVRWQMIKQNPAQLVDPPPIGKREMTALDRDQARELLKAAEKERYYPVFVFLLSSGCRPGEAFGLKWSDVDWPSGSVTINRAIYWRPKRQGWVLTEPKTAASRRTIPLGKAVMKTLTDWKRRQAEDRLRAGSEWQHHDFVFTKLTGAPLDLETLRDRFKVVTERAKLTGIRLYDLRHSCASILMAEGQNPKIVSERLGHANIALTLGTYSHVSKGMQEEASQKLENALFG